MKHGTKMPCGNTNLIAQKNCKMAAIFQLRHQKVEKLHRTRKGGGIQKIGYLQFTLSFLFIYKEFFHSAFSFLEPKGRSFRVYGRV